ncbi:hypothetical protein LTR22_013145 [Elasticomyces elasticus]|nr:hypothetical protein LTR22_013145 [Elasticomyces elasticus]KAK4928732.1 hypothetical protein LTR49_004541 [Elasticomyces elasticus]
MAYRGAVQGDADVEVIELEMRHVKVSPGVSPVIALGRPPTTTSAMHSSECPPPSTPTVTEVTLKTLQDRHTSNNDAIQVGTLELPMTPTISASPDSCSDSSPSFRPQGCSFFHLPRELRDIIYDLVLPKGKHLTTPKGKRLATLHANLSNEAQMIASTIPSMPTHEQAKIPALLHASAVIRAETLPLYFALNTFILDLGVIMSQSRRTLQWLRAMDSYAISSMRRLTIVGMVACAKLDHAPEAHWFLADVSLFPIEDAVDVRDSTVSCPLAKHRLERAVGLLESYVQHKNTTQEATNTLQQKTDLIAVLQQVHRKLQLPKRCKAWKLDIDNVRSSIRTNTSVIAYEKTSPTQQSVVLCSSSLA